MKKLALVFLFIAVAESGHEISKTENSWYGKSKNNFQQIFQVCGGGKTSDTDGSIVTMPWVVQVRAKVDGSDRKCIGVIISETQILAPHWCLDGNIEGPVSFKTKSAISRQIESSLVHKIGQQIKPPFSGYYTINFNDKLKFTSELMPICIAKDPDYVKTEGFKRFVLNWEDGDELQIRTVDKKIFIKKLALSGTYSEYVQPEGFDHHPNGGILAYHMCGSWFLEGLQVNGIDKPVVFKVYRRIDKDIRTSLVKMSLKSPTGFRCKAKKYFTGS